EHTHAFLYTSASGIVDLNTLIAPLSGWELLDASDINDAGQITGQGLIGGEYHAYLLTLIPSIPGDFNNNGVVDAADYIVWRKIDRTQDGYNASRSHISHSSRAGTSPSQVAVPESSSALLLIMAAALVTLKGYVI